MSAEPFPEGDPRFAGAFGQIGAVPLLVQPGDSLRLRIYQRLQMGFGAEHATPTAILQNDGLYIKPILPGLFFCEYCSLIRETKAGDERCKRCDWEHAKLVVAGTLQAGKPYRCWAGMWDSCSLINLNLSRGANTTPLGKPVASIYCGQKRDAKDKLEELEANLKEVQEVTGIAREKLLLTYNGMPGVAFGDIQTAAEALESHAKEISDVASHFFNEERQMEYSRTLFEAVISIQGADSEQKAILDAMLHLERLNYPFVMISFLKVIDGERFVVADPGFCTGQKWPLIAPITKRSFDKGDDLLPRVLERNAARFVLDSRNDPENDRDICMKYNIVSQYAMPLATESLMIGTLQVDMGVLDARPEFECTMLDAVAAQLSIVIERHRAVAELERVDAELMNQARVLAFDTAASKIMHELMHAIGDFADRLRSTITNPEIRSNKAALGFLLLTQKRVLEWINSVKENVRALRTNEQVDAYEVQEIVKEIVALWYRKAQLRHCNLHGDYSAPGKRVYLRLGALKELLSCLIINAIEANARDVRVTVRSRLRRDRNALEREHVEIVVSDDGDGIPLEFKENLGRFGWTTKSKIGHGMGITVVDLLSKRMGGGFDLISCGKCAGEARTEFLVFLPTTPRKEITQL